MAEIIPAILPRNYEDLKNKIALVRGHVPIVQVDICDGIFVKNMTWPFPDDQHFAAILGEQEGMPFWEDIDFELDLMVADAVENFDIYTKLGPKRIIFHLEAVGLVRGRSTAEGSLEEFKHFLEGIDTYIRDSIQIGVAISPNTVTTKIFPLINYIDFVQVMGIDHEGGQGEEFDEKCLEHIKTLKEKFPDIIISVDGGVNFETAPKILDAGAERLVIGSAIFNTDDIIGTIENFRQI